MSFMQTLFGGSTQKSGLDRDFKNLFTGNVGSVQNDAANLQARQFAGFTPDWLQGAQMTRNTAQNGPGFGSVNTAAGALSNSLGYNPQQVNAGPGVGAQSFLNANVNAYMSPYLDQVANRFMQGNERARQMAQVNDAAKMTAASAFSNSRRGIVDSQTNEAYDRNSLDSLANIYNQGFGQATNLIQGDQNRALTADQFNAEQAMRAQMANQNAGLQGQQLTQGAAVNLANVGGAQQTMGYQAGQAMQGIGTEQQQLSQAQMDAIRNLPMERQQMIQAALGLNVGGGSGMTSTSKSSTGIVPATGSFLSGLGRVL
jgi:hypothetical protein